MAERVYRVEKADAPEPGEVVEARGQAQVLDGEELESLLRIERKLDLLLNASGVEEEK